MFYSVSRVAALALGVASVPAVATLPAPSPLGSAFAFKSASGGGYYAANSGAGTAIAGYVNPQSGPKNYAVASVTFAPTAAVDLTATNAVTGSAGSVAHGELHYDYLATIANPTFAYVVGDAYSNVVTVSGHSSIDTAAGFNSSLTVTTTAQSGFSQIGQFFNETYGDGSTAAPYAHSSAFSIGGAGQFKGIETTGGIDYAVFTGSIVLYATVNGTTTTTTTYDQFNNPIQTTTIDNPGGTGSLFLDPTIVVNSSFALASGGTAGTVQLSDGIANTPASGTPEPAAWALLLAGFGFVGASQRRRRTVAA